MHTGRIVIITGSPGTGKTTAAALAARQSTLARSVHMHTDDFYQYLSKGAIAPHLPASHEQNSIVISAFLEAAKCFAANGYDVIVDGIVGPWFLEPWLRLAQIGFDVHYIVLRDSLEQTLKRAVGRSKLDRETNTELVETMWIQFASLGKYERHVISTDNLSIQETVSAIQNRIADQTALLA